MFYAQTSLFGLGFLVFKSLVKINNNNNKKIEIFAILSLKPHESRYNVDRAIEHGLLQAKLKSKLCTELLSCLHSILEPFPAVFFPVPQPLCSQAGTLFFNVRFCRQSSQIRSMVSFF